jgi:circadian clock protein KaiB
MSRGADYRFRLYVAGEAENSARALVNLQAICRDSLPARHTIEVVDVFKDPGRALADRIFMTPTLVKLGPGQVRTIVGTLSDADTVLSALGLRAVEA